MAAPAVPPENITTSVNSKGGVTTTYSVQQKPALVHLLEPYFPKAVAAIDEVLTPIINLGYSELTPDAGPHLAPGGQLVNRDGEPVTGIGTARSAQKKASPSGKSANVAKPTHPSARTRPATTKRDKATNAASARH